MTANADVPLYEPMLKDIRMSDQGFWVVTWSIRPGADLSVMVGGQGLTREEAAVQAWGMLPHTGADYLPSERAGAPVRSTAGRRYIQEGS